MTNYEKIQSMSVEELAEMFDLWEDVVCLPCNPKYCDAWNADGTCQHDKGRNCRQATVKWLGSEVEE